ncbi:hypothetical protein GCM10007874_68950 [Labrys miyagiensis]|uniref:Transposase n=1 Tax=Labrys miyagiensis TaxID=346912 RepID=A0ABQ6CUT3_9HYPH|nr:hypothetical protein GCM10007874_68950 [Labrys miyagiensis]
MQHEVRVWKTSHKVIVGKRTDGRWEAVGTYLDVEIRVTGRDEASALHAWVAEARARGV